MILLDERTNLHRDEAQYPLSLGVDKVQFIIVSIAIYYPSALVGVMERLARA